MLLNLVTYIVFFILIFENSFAQTTSLSSINKINVLPDTDFFSTAKHIYSTHQFVKNDTATAKFYLRLGKLFYSTENNLIEAISLTQKSNQILLKLKLDNTLLSKSYYNLGYFYSESKRYSDAINAFQNVLYFEKESVQRIITLHALSNSYHQIGDFQKAIEISKLGLELCRMHKQYQIIFVNNLVLNYNELGLFGRAIKLAVKYPLGNQTILFANNVANSYEGLKKYEESRNIYSEISKIYLNEKKYFELVSYPLNNAIYTYIQEKKYQKALYYTLKADEICKQKLSNIRGETIARLYENQGFAYYKLKKNRLSLNSYQKALLKFPFNYNDTNTLHILPSILLTTAGNKPYLLSILESKGLVLVEIYLENHKINYAKSSLNHFLQADAIIDQMRQEHTEQGSKLFWREKTHSFYENAIETCFRTKNFDKGFYFMEKSRAILLLDALKDLEGKKVLSESQQTAEQELRYKTIGLQNKLDNLDEKDKNYAETYQKLIDTKENYNTFIKSLEKSNPAYYQLKYSNTYITLNELRSKLKTQKQSFIEFFVGQKYVYAMCITQNKVDFKKINLSQYKTMANEYIKFIAQKPPHTQAQFNNLTKSAYQLNQLIFGHFQLPKGRVIISNDNYFIPFNSLVSNVNKPTFLIEDYAFSYAYSANVLFRNNSQDLSFFNRKFLGFAPVNYQKSQNLNSLLGSDKVLDNIEKLYFSGQTFLYENASKENFIKHSPNYSIIQLFTHGKADSADINSKIYFQDKPLNSSELYELEKLKAELVVLSACETNLGKNATGEGIMSFARGFAYLGVPSTISTLWSVNNEATYQITESFYKYLNTGNEKDIALQKAQIDYYKNSGNINPYYWSGIVLIGNADKFKSNNLAYSLITIILLVLLYLVLRKIIAKNSTRYKQK